VASTIGQVIAVSGMSLRSLPARWSAAAVVVVCIAGVSGVMVSMLAMAEGFERTYRRAGAPDRAVVLSTGETSEAASAITRAQLPLVLAAPGLARGADGRPLASVERYTTSTLPLREGGADGSLVLRGVGPGVAEVRDEVRLRAGRWFTPGLRELVAGSGAAAQFPLDLGAQPSLSGESWTVVGIFDGGGTALDSETWADVEAVMDAYRMPAYSSVTARLEGADALQAFADAIGSNPALSHSAQRETEYYAAQGGTLTAAMRVLGYVVAGIMGLGAVFAAANTMFSAIEARSVEIATLRAIGFRAPPIVASVLLEGLVLCLAGSIAGGALAWLLFNGYTVSTVSGAAMAQLVFAFSVTPALLLQGAALATAIGLAGGVFPAVRAARAPVLEVLRAA
jgi:putative ABC transport system permease protein